MNPLLPTKGERTRAAKRALDLSERLETFAAEQAEATLTEVPGLNRDAIEQLYADELTRRPVPNRAVRRECKRRGHVAKAFDDITICARCERRIA